MNKHFLYAVVAFGSWGLFPLFWKQVSFLSSGNTIAVRIVVTAITSFVILRLKKVGVKASLSSSDWLKLSLATLLIGFNWFIYVYAINTGQVLQGSLGYFMAPGLSILLGVCYLGEKLSIPQKIAFLFFIVAIIILSLEAKAIPWIALALASSFAIYGLIKKRLPLPAEVSLVYETACLAPLCLIFLATKSDIAVSSLSSAQLALLALTGVVTYTPMYFFTRAAQGLTLSTLGTLQYIAPFGQFLIGYLVYGEPLSRNDIFAYALVWTGIFLFSSSRNFVRPRYGVRLVTKTV